MNKKILSLALAGIVAGGLSACEESSAAAPSIEDNEAATATKIAEFTETCEGKGGTVQVNETCAGGNTCEGFNPNTGEEWICAGYATCEGSVWCDETMEETDA